MEEENGDGGGGGGGGAGGVGGAVVERLVVFISLEDFSMWTAPNLATTRETIDMVPQPHSCVLDVQKFISGCPIFLLYNSTMYLDVLCLRVLYMY